MSGCEIKSGFFVLRPCTEMVAGRCKTCLRAMCRKHAEPGGLERCLDCAARERQQALRTERKHASASTATRRRRDYDDDWMYERRSHLRSGSSSWRTHRGHAGGAAGAAAVAAAQAHADFDAQDEAAFDNLHEQRDDLAFDAPGFGDS